jgi:sulfate transport system substrate-binding protein
LIYWAAEDFGYSRQQFAIALGYNNGSFKSESLNAPAQRHKEFTVKKIFAASLLAAGLAVGSAAQAAAPSLLNVSYDVMRDFYKDYNAAFQKHWEAEHKEKPAIQMSFGGSSKQARSVIDGLPADVITMNMATDINALADNGELVPKNWVTRLPNNSAPFTSATVFIVRKGNPKALKDWPDLVKDGVEVVVPNPKTSGNGRYTYLSAWGYTLKNGGDEAAAKKFVGELFSHVPVLDTGGRGATTTFMTNHIGDVLVTFENEAEMIAREFGRDQFEVVYPSVSAEAEPPVSVVDKVVDKKGTRAVAEEYLKYLWSPEGQEIAAANYLRPRDPAVLAKYNDRFPKVDFLSVDKTFGDWRTVQKTHFNDGGVFDQIYPAK